MWIFKRAIRLSVLLGIAAACSTAHLKAAAESPGPQDDCSKVTTTASMRTCEVVRYTKDTEALRVVYNRLMAQLDAPARTKLIAVEAAWEHFRDANEDFQADAARGGTMSLVLRVSTAADMTEARTAELKKLLH